MLIFIFLIAVMGSASPAQAQLVTVKGLISVVNEKGPSQHRPESGNAVIWLRSADGSSSQTPKGNVSQQEGTFTVVQHNKRFSPHLSVVPVGSVVAFPNHDPFFHNVFSLFDGKRFDLGLYEAGTTHSVNFDRPGICFIFCNIHPEMGAVIVVLDTPYYAISNSAGEFTIPNVPPGRYFLTVWHERCPASVKSFPREVFLSVENASLGTIRLEESGDLLIPHQNKYGYDYATPNPPGPLYDTR